MVLKVDVPPKLIHGDVDEGYGPVADAFRRNFAERGEIRAACAVDRDGGKVVDLWGGYRDGRTRTPWREDTRVVMFPPPRASPRWRWCWRTRAPAGLRRAVAAYWPQFAWRAKEAITVRQVLSHQIGLTDQRELCPSGRALPQRAGRTATAPPPSQHRPRRPTTSKPAAPRPSNPEQPPLGDP
jgi:CubicO group peptidase (beta-lactamase class C family)